MPRLFALLCATAAVGLAACGPDSADGELSASEYRERGNRICREAEREARKALRAEDPVDAIDGSLRQAELSQRRFEELEPPDELRRLHDRSIRQGREALRLLRGARDSVEAQRLGELREFQRKVRGLVEEGNRTVRDLGLRDCVADQP